MLTDPFASSNPPRVGGGRFCSSLWSFASLQFANIIKMEIDFQGPLLQIFNREVTGEEEGSPTHKLGMASNLIHRMNLDEIPPSLHLNLIRRFFIHVLTFS